MTSQRDEAVGHVADDEMTDDPIVVERHDEILGGPPVDDPEADDAPARDAADEGLPPGDQPGEETAGDELASDRMASGAPASDELASDEPSSDEPSSDELVGRHAVPETDSTGLDQEPPPLVVPADPASEDDPAAPGWAATSGTQAVAPAPGAPVTPGTTPVDASPEDASPAGTTTAPAGGVDAGTPATSAGEPAGAPNGDGVPAAALAGQQWPAIQAMFVDDPKGSVQRAAAAADEVVKAFVASLQREQEALRAAWDKDTSTEDLRTALQQYRAFCGRLEGLA
jgi:hypothetical protein